MSAAITPQSRKKKLLPEVSQDLTDNKPRSQNVRTPLLLLLGFGVLLCGAFLFTGRSVKSGSDSSCRNYSYQVYRYGNLKKIKFNNCANTLEDLIILSQSTFNDTTIARLTSEFGEEIKSMDEVVIQDKVKQDFHLIALNDNERFHMPALKIGEEKKLRLKVGSQEVKITTLSARPKVFQLDNFLKDEECDHMINRITKEKLERSLVGEQRDLSDYRTSSQTWIGPSQRNDDAVFDEVRKRAHELTRLPYDLGEDTQVVNYQAGQHYYSHHDYFPKNSENNFYAQGGNRLVTVLYYLNDVLRGGETLFPYVNTSFDPFTNGYPYTDASKACSLGGLKVKPSKGGAVLFYSLLEVGHMDGDGDLYSLHAGCDPIDSEKWIVNQWIYNKRVDGRLFN